MSSADPTSGQPAPTRRRVRVSAALLLALLTFAAGVAVAVGVIRQYDGWLAMPARPAQPSSAVASAPSTGAVFQPPAEAGASIATGNAAGLDARAVALSTQLAGLEARAVTLDRDARAAAGNAGRAEALLVAFAARRAIDRGAPLGPVEEALRRRFAPAQGPAVAAIVAAAGAPVTLETLRASLDTLAPDLTSGVANGDWWASIRRELAGLIVIRRETTPTPRPADRLDRIRRLIDAGQVDAAIADVALLPGAPQAAEWTKAARRYVEAHRALDAIEAAALVGSPDAAPATR